MKSKCCNKIRNIFLVVGLAFSLASSAQINTGKMLTIGRNALYFEDYILSIQYFNKVIRVKPYLPDPYYFRAVAKFNLDDYKGAEKDCSSALDKNPFMVNAYNVRGIARQRMDNHTEAENDFTEGLAVENNNTYLLFNRGNSRMALKKFDKAIEDYSAVLEIEPTKVNALINRGMAKFQSNDTIEGLADLEKAIEVNPYRKESYVSRAIVYYQMSSYQESLNDFNKAIELDSRDVQLYLNRAIARYQLSDLKGMMVDFEKAIELDPKNAVAYCNRGILRAEVGDLNNAIADFSRVLALDPTNTSILYYRSLMYLETGQLQDALRGLNIVAHQYPEFAPLYYARSKVKQQLGNMAEAEIDYMTAIKLDSDRREKGNSGSNNMAKKDDDKSKSEPVKGKKATRKKSDKSLKNYNQIVVLDDFGDSETEEETGESIRGRVQDRNFVIDMEPVFGTSFYSIDSVNRRSRYFEKSIEELNNQDMFERELFLTNREAEEENFNSLAHFANINSVSRKIDLNSFPKELLLIRGVLYSVVINYNNAIDDYTKLIEQDSENILAYFNRAYTRYKMVESFQEFEEENNSVPQIGTFNSAPDSKVEKTILDYDLVLKDLNTVIQLDPKFEFAYYNRAILKCILKDFKGAVVDFEKAIEVNPDFAEAYFNRGLVRIFLDDDEGGTLDLSRAGELGLYKAYNVIKRYGKMSSEAEMEK